MFAGENIVNDGSVVSIVTELVFDVLSLEVSDTLKKNVINWPSYEDMSNDIEQSLFIPDGHEGSIIAVKGDVWFLKNNLALLMFASEYCMLKLPFEKLLVIGFIFLITG